MSSNVVKPEKYGYLHLVYHFAVPLKIFWVLLTLMALLGIKVLL